jgi:branched-chain amino acid aminotransferase
LRIFVSRGPGDFSPNPYSTVGAQIYIISMPFQSMPNEKYEKGASAIVSTVHAKPGIYAQVKSCNYLPNVMTKKEALDQGADFSINFTANDLVAEGPTENILILTPEKSLLAPKFDYTLRGTTLLRVLEIGKRLKSELGLKEVGTKILKRADLDSAIEMMMVGTTLGVLPVTQFAGSAVGNGKVGAIAKRLNEEVMKLIEG